MIPLGLDVYGLDERQALRVFMKVRNQVRAAKDRVITNEVIDAFS